MNDERSEHEPAAAESDPLPSGSLLPLFSTPFNWCDRRCERCPLAEECPLNRRERQRRWLHEARGEDPDSPAVALSDAEGELARALALAQAIAIEEGIDLDAPLPPLPVCLDEVRLRRAGLELTVALHAGLEADGSELTCALPAVVVDEAMRAGATLAAKCARIGGYLAERHEDIWTADAVPNLLLMERLGRQLDNALAAIEALPVPRGSMRCARGERNSIVSWSRSSLPSPRACAVCWRRTPHAVRRRHRSRSWSLLRQTVLTHVSPFLGAESAAFPLFRGFRPRSDPRVEPAGALANQRKFGVSALQKRAKRESEAAR